MLISRNEIHFSKDSVVALGKGVIVVFQAKNQRSRAYRKIIEFPDDIARQEKRVLTDIFLAGQSVQLARRTVPRIRRQASVSLER